MVRLLTPCSILFHTGTPAENNEAGNETIRTQTKKGNLMNNRAAHFLPRLLSVITVLSLYPTLLSSEKPSTTKDKKQETEKIIVDNNKPQPKMIVNQTKSSFQTFGQEMGLSEDEIKMLSHSKL